MAQSGKAGTGKSHTSLRWVGSANQRVIDVQESLKGGKVLAWGELKDVES